MIIHRQDSLPYDGRTFHRLQVEPEPGDTVHDLYDVIHMWREETSATYFRIDLVIPTRRHDVDPKGWGELDVVIDGDFQLDCFLKALRMARALVPEKG